MFDPAKNELEVSSWPELVLILTTMEDIIDSEVLSDFDIVLYWIENGVNDVKLARLDPSRIKLSITQFRRVATADDKLRARKFVKRVRAKLGRYCRECNIDGLLSFTEFNRFLVDEDEALIKQMLVFYALKDAFLQISLMFNSFWLNNSVNEYKEESK